MKIKLIIKLGHLPPSELNPNNLRRLHWAMRSQIMRDARTEMGWLAKVQWKDQKPMEKARISYEFILKDKRKRDVDNLLASCKPYTDGLIDAGVILYDDIKHLEIGLVRAVYDVKDDTIITVEELK